MFGFIPSYPVLGFSGSRAFVPQALAAVHQLVGSSAAVVTGCAGGVDAATRVAFPAAVVYQAAAYSGTFVARLAQRSAAAVRHVVSSGGLWCAFPSTACPSALAPCAAPFKGCGSGTWAALSLAIHLKGHCLLFLPVGVPPPLWLAHYSTAAQPSPCGGRFILILPPPTLF